MNTNRFERAGILPDFYDIWGDRHEASDATKQALLTAMDSAPEESDGLLPPVVVAWTGREAEIAIGDVPSSSWCLTLENGQVLSGDIVAGTPCLRLPAELETGYHEFELVRDGQTLARCSVIVCPPSCHQPEDNPRYWGLAVQLYGLRSKSNWGLGDYADLIPVIDWAASHGAALLGLNPLHALFPNNPGHCSPYSPSSRRYYNVLHIAVQALPEFGHCEEAHEWVASPAFQSRLADLRRAELVDYAEVAALKMPILDSLYRHFRAHDLAGNTEHGQAFRAFQTRGGEDLRLFALYHALLDDFSARDAALWGWPVWPTPFRRHDSPEVAAFAAAQAERIEWHVWLQWHADRQLADAAQHCRERGMPVGLYQDLAVGVDKGGAETWAHPELFALDVRVGCPPDDFNPLGQDWGLPPWIPQRLRAAGYAPYIAMLRANMRHAGALRLDHVMGLMRLYWIPPAMRGDAGAYVTYPFEDLLGILNLESRRNRCLIVGEDLGTVPDEVRTALRDAGVLSYKLFYSERQQNGHFFSADWFPDQSLVAASTHDLPTLAGFWQGRDIALRTALDLYPRAGMREEQLAARAEDRKRLLDDLTQEGLLPAGISTDPDALPALPPALIRAIHVHLARSRARLALVQAEDMLGQVEQANQPGTVDEHPNWRRRLTHPLEDWSGEPDCQALAGAMATERPA